MTTKTVWKFSHAVTDQVTIQGPAPLNVVHVEPDGPGRLLIWAEVGGGDPDLLTRRLYVVGTGHPVPPDSTHLGSVVAPPFVWHLYDGGLE